MKHNPDVRCSAHVCLTCGDSVEKAGAPPRAVELTEHCSAKVVFSKQCLSYDRLKEIFSNSSGRFLSGGLFQHYPDNAAVGYRASLLFSLPRRSRPEVSAQAAGLLAVSVGLLRQYRDDIAQLEAGLHLYDALYRWARDGTGRRA